MKVMIKTKKRNRPGTIDSLLVVIPGTIDSLLVVSCASTRAECLQRLLAVAGLVAVECEVLLYPRIHFIYT